MQMVEDATAGAANIAKARKEFHAVANDQPGGAVALDANDSAACIHSTTIAVLKGIRDPISGETFSVERCTNCDLVLTRPRPVDLETYYPSEYHAFVRDNSENPMERLRQWLAAHVVYRPIAVHPPATLLDVGCGTGRLAAEFIRLGWEVHGAEPNERARQLATERGVIIDGPRIENAVGPFEAIVFNHSLEHIPDPHAALRSAHDRLRPGGLVGVVVPDFGSWQRRVFAEAWLQLDVPRHVSHFEHRSLTSLMARCGLTPIYARRTPFLPTLTCSLQNKFGFQLPPKLHRLLNYALFPPQLLVPGDCLTVIARRDNVVDPHD
jgi:SAM-dependent methyltransferase